MVPHRDATRASTHICLVSVQVSEDPIHLRENVKQCHMTERFQAVEQTQLGGLQKPETELLRNLLCEIAVVRM